MTARGCFSTHHLSSWSLKEKMTALSLSLSFSLLSIILFLHGNS
jgi:hypothetical protein